MRVIVLGAAGLLAAIVVFVFYMEKIACGQYSESSGLRTEFRWAAGCVVVVNR